MVNAFIIHLQNQYGTELEIEKPRFQNMVDSLRSRAVAQYPTMRIAEDGKAAGTINVADVEVLYLLVRHLKPKVIFEIGTWIGTSALIMAEAIRKNNNGGIIYTCDANSYYSLSDDYDDVIKPINAFSDVALDELPRNTKIDMVFADGELTFKTIQKLKNKLETKSIIATHDYVLPDDKGVLNAVRMQLKSNFQYAVIAPSYKKQEPDKWKESLIGILVPSKFNNDFYVKSDNYLTRILSTIKVAMTALLAKAVNKIAR